MTSTIDAESANISSNESLSIAPSQLYDPAESDSGPFATVYQYGSLSSQYFTLDPVFIPPLEKAVLLSLLRAFEEALVIFDSFPPETRHHPIVAYEHAMVYWYQWSLLDCAKVLQDALAWAEAHATNFNQHGIYTLLRVFAGKLDLFTKADFTRGRDGIREIRSWLMNTRLEAYGDIEIQCLNQYYFLLKVAAHVTLEFDDQPFRCIPHVSEESGSLNISQLRENLQNRGCLYQARAILHIELGFLTSHSAKQGACRYLLRACATSESIEPIWFVGGWTRLKLAESLSQDDQVEDAAREFGLARTLLQQAPIPAPQNHSELSIKLAELKVTQCTDESLALGAWIRFVDQVSNTQDFYIISVALCDIVSVALEILRKTPNEENKKIFWQWQSRAESLLEQVGDIYFLYLYRITVAEAALNLMHNYGAILQWQEDFDDKYPDFRLWAIKIMGKTKKQFIYSLLKDESNSFKTIKEIEKLTFEMEAFWTEEGYDPLRRSNQDMKPHPELGQHSILTSHVRSQWFYEWAQELPAGRDPTHDNNVVVAGTSDIAPSQVTEQILLRWLKRDASQGHLSRARLACILVIEDEQVDVHDFLSQMTPESLSIRLFGPASSPTPIAVWEKIFSTLSEWLLDHAKYHETKRHFLLLKLQDIRAIKIDHSTSTSVDKLIEGQRLLDLLPKLNAETQSFTATNIPVWRNLVSILKTRIYFETHGHGFLDEEVPEFLEILSSYRTSLEEFRKQGALYPQACVLIFIVQLYFFAAQKLRPAALNAYLESLKSADIIFQKIRESWKYLRGWDKVEKLLLSSEGNMRLQIFPLALHILREFPAPQEQLRNDDMWSIIQAAKSVGLGWLMRTNGLEQLEGVSLNSLELSSDFKETPPVTVEEMQLITDDAGGEVVYIDWFNGSTVGYDMPKPLITTVSPGERPRVSSVEMTWVEINKILERLLLFDEKDLLSEEGTKLLYKLGPLVTPLATCSKPGQVLVFSAVGNLHRVPFHALPVEGEILIRRNPIVYSSSLTVLNLVFQTRKETEQTSLRANRPFRTAVFGDAPTALGQKTLNTVAKRLSVEPHVRDAFTSWHFREAIRAPDLDLLHYHGHVTFEETAPKDQGLELEDRRFTLRDVFALAPVRNSYHATLLGCGSGMSKTSVSNDVVGLVPAFLYSGAASTVSTLWKFDDKDASLYSKHFYTDVWRLLQASGSGRVDLARANQTAVLKIMEKRPALYHWAPFVLNGYWMMEVRGNDNSGELGEDIG